jgi:molybdopterin converting factor small subunit
MDVELRCYGGVKMAAETGSMTLQVGDDATVADALDRLADQVSCSTHTVEWDHLVVRREREHIDTETPLDDGDVLSVSESPMPE